ncbi:2'-5' RNA ligase [Anaerobacillus alkalidiazotrophicus]|uniref:RNA 2',3'-cyclic phosphodiesterase n=1 Tax=Anaerobacillus alkalidiazotrophicus TaxID=472963 RepID=A0A1S2M5W8_9BACI|nr:RNA 2',3'-cyclic phosphodiesterase [Anaerobacillus alkalidiazotrophicus]OIJ18579.1 2'-5' RNA ligase [Anaerobacillus alkalidiazotrophicus]OIJ20024.1 2'-5' RNA ligase [Anaerobacillus alkalidiazotrophicus]
MQPHYFIAIPIEKRVRKKLAAWNRDETPPFERFVHEEDYHITLAFLGGIEFSLIKNLQEKLHVIADKHQTFPLIIDHIGHFGPNHAPRILWAGIKKEDKLFKLQMDVFQACLQLGMELDKRAYNPHITIARKFKGASPFDKLQLNRSFQSVVIEEKWKVSNFVIYQTHLQRTPKYEVISSFTLANEE